MRPVRMTRHSLSGHPSMAETGNKLSAPKHLLPVGMEREVYAPEGPPLAPPRSQRCYRKPSPEQGF